MARRDCCAVTLFIPAASIPSPARERGSPSRMNKQEKIIVAVLFAILIGWGFLAKQRVHLDQQAIGLRLLDGTMMGNGPLV